MFDALMTLRPEIAALSQRPGALGNVFWVNSTGSDAITNSGLDPSSPLATIARALVLCQNGHDDYILCTGVWDEAGMPIVINKTRVHIIGIGGTLMCPAQTLHATGNTAIFTVSALSNECEIAGFSFGGGAAHGAIENIAGTPMGLNIHHCVFGHAFAGNTPLHGINIRANATAITISNCIFLGTGNNAGGTITDDGINFTVSADTLGGLICNNLFVGIPGVGIDIDTMGTGLMIVDNVFALDANTQGAAITLRGNCLGNFVARNSANFGDTAMAATPFQDNAGAGANTWVANQSGGGGLANTPWDLPA